MGTKGVGAIVAVMILAEGAFALTYIGPPTTNMRLGQWAVGGSYSYSEQDIEIDGGDVEDFEIETALARVSVGLATNRMELFGLVGGANDEDDEFSGDYEAAIGGGVRVTTNLGNPLSWGLVAQAVYFEPDGLELTDVQVGIGPCWRPDPCILYGGALLHFITGNVDDDLGGGDIEQDSWIGAYIGGGIELWQHAMVSVEGQVTGGGAGGAFAFTWRF